MKSRISTCVASVTIFSALVILARMSAREQDDKPKHHHYKLTEVGTFGGPSSSFNNFYAGPFFDSGKVLNKRGTLSGWADTSTPDPFPSLCLNPECFVSHAFQWHDGVFTDIGGLVDDWSSQVTWINDRGEIVGLSQNGVIDPLIGFPEQRAVRWRNGQIRDLGTLGGNQSVALSVNNQGEIAGLALNEIPDPFSIYDLLYFGSSNGTQTRAVLWDREGNAQDLGTLGGPDAYALLVNEHGQVAGWSYTNSIPNASSGGLPTFHPFLWEKGKGIEDLGTLGGTIAQAVNGLNERGEVVGATTLAGDMTFHPFVWDGKKLNDLGTLGGDNGEVIWVNDAGEVVGGADYTAQCRPGVGGDHAFLWRNGAMIDLGTVNDSPYSEADFINDRTQIVGNSFNCDFSRMDAFLWEKGSIVDLNSLISSDAAVHLAVASYIDNRGEIVAIGILPDGDGRAVLLIPCDLNHPNIVGCDYSLVDGTTTPDVTSPSVPHGLITLPQVRPGLPGEFLRLRIGQHLGPRNRALRAQTTTPTLNTQSPALMAEVKCPGGAVTDDSNADQLVDLAPPFHPGHCKEEFGKLTGSCAMSLPVGPGCAVFPAPTCHRGATAKRPGLWECCGRMACVKIPVDLDSACQ